MSKGLAISLCDLSGKILIPWADHGYDCYAVDIQHSIRQAQKRNSIHFVWGDVRSWCPPPGRAAFVAAFPPCTHLAACGARDWQTKGLSLYSDGLELFNACLLVAAWSGAPYLIENPVGRLSGLRRPDYYFDPCDYGDPYTKRTCLWTGNGFVMPPKAPVFPSEGSKMHRMSPSPHRAKERSETPMGFAVAVFRANCRDVWPLEDPPTGQAGAEDGDG